MLYLPFALTGITPLPQTLYLQRGNNRGMPLLKGIAMWFCMWFCPVT
jgi:hypothetical protein